ncbi:MAG TPA: D-alanine--D-alanine ligase, partial [Gemmatimonadales bacterium]|nr:D-alanine--D-alanine ligase [Gemmatimonadales bacterium]
EALRLMAERELGPRLAELEAIRHTDVVFLVLHGRLGEGGSMQALLDLVGVPYTGSGPLGSAIAMDKDVAKRLLRFAGVPTPDWHGWPATPAEIAALGFPLIVKPSKVGSTVGLTLVRDVGAVPAAVQTALQFDDEVLLERYVSGRELTVGILNDRALAVGEIIPRHEIFDYECKYTPGMSREIFPADLPEDVTKRVQALALAAHRTLKLRDFSRIDFRLDDAGVPHCLEANTLPGLTPTSLLPQSAAAMGIGFDALCQSLCDLALRRGRARNKVPGTGKN